MDDKISAYQTLQLMEKREADGLCIDGQCHRECIADLHKAITNGELKHKQLDLKKFDGLMWIEFIGERMRYGNEKMVKYQEDIERGLPVKEAYNFWLAYTKFYTILFDELGDMLCRDYEKCPREAANGLEQSLKDLIEFILKQ